IFVSVFSPKQAVLIIFNLDVSSFEVCSTNVTVIMIMIWIATEQSVEYMISSGSNVVEKKLSGPKE
ncbi:MAG: hypothetical protein LBT59_01600, partial [Clostridiales bacterium]|nr:hypothetical protein [Clostridiales bacterium]